MQIRQSHFEKYKHCPYQYKLQYIDNLKVISTQDPADPRTVGTMFHMSIEKDIQTAINWYYNQYYIINDNHINEVIKLKSLYPKLRILVDSLGNDIKSEVNWEYSNFTGTIDILLDDSIYDMKYSNNIQYYLDSAQLNIYAYFINKLGIKVNKLGFIFIPKTQIRQKKTENILDFRKRLVKTLSTMEPEIRMIEYDQSKVDAFIKFAEDIKNINLFEKNESKSCQWCDYCQYCKTNKEVDYMIIPENKPRVAKVNLTPDMWLYGRSYSGKTVFMSTFDSVLMINTDGNIDHITTPVISIKDELTVNGRLTSRKYAWENFKDIVTELEKKQNSFKTVVIDLVEDLYEHCRLYIYNKLEIEHESDSSFAKAYDMIRTEFLSNIKRLKNCGYQTVLISKEITSEIIKRGGDKITIIKPNIPDKIANVLAGTVDMTARIVAEGNERFMSFKTSEFIYGGGRYNFGVDKIPLNKQKFIELMTTCQKLGGVSNESSVRQL